MPTPHISVAAAVAVVGGGLAGLTAAIELAQSGRQVTLYDQASNLGGRAATRQVSGFSFNMGPHALYVKGAACRILKSYGIEFRGHRPPLAGGRALVDGTVDALPIDAKSMWRAKWLPLSAKFQVLKFLARVPRFDPLPWQGQPVDEWLRSTLKHQRARDFLRSLLRLSTYCPEPLHLDAAAAIQQLQLAFSGGVLYLDGGWQTLVEGLHQQARLAGVEIVRGERVRAVRRQSASDGGAWCLDLSAGRQATAAGVVLAVGPDAVIKLLGEDLSAPVASNLRAQQCVEAACLDVALETLPDPELLFALGIDEPTYFSVHSATADLAPRGGALIHLLRYCESSSNEPRLKRQELEKIFEQHLDRLQPGWRPHLVERQLLPRMTVCHGLPMPGLERPAERIPGLEGIFLAGDWVGDQGLLADAAVASGQKAARQLIARGEASFRAA